MITHDFLLLLGVKTLILSLAAIVVFFVLRVACCHSPKIHRSAWGAVLLLGIIGAGIPLHLPVSETTVETATETTSPAKEPITEVIFPHSEPGAPVVSVSEVAVPMTTTFAAPPAPIPDSIHVPAASFESTSTVDLTPQFDPTFYVKLFCYVWAIGIVFILLGQFLLHLLLLRKLHSAVVVTGDHAGEWQNILAEYGISPKRLPLLLTDEIGPGLIWRFFGAAVLVPRDLWEEATSEIRDGILRHELAHYRNHDLLRSGFSRILAVVHWFNPISWFVLHKMDEATEWLCDLVAFGRNQNGTLQFAESLVAVHETSQSILLNRITFGGGSLKWRLSQLQSFLEKQKDSIMKKTIVCTLLVLLFMASIFHVQFVPVIAEDAKPEITESVQENTIPGITITLTDQQGNPASTGYVRTYPNPRPADWEGDQPRNFELENGKCFIPLSNIEKLNSFKTVFYADGFCPYEMSWKDETIPDTFAMKLEPAESIGGIVVNEKGEPVVGAEVQFSVSLAGRQKTPDMIMNYAQWRNTDSEGRWIYKVLPLEQLGQNFDMQIEHPDYPRLRIPDGQTFKDYQVKDAQGNYSKTTILLNGLPLKGKIVDEQDNPIEGVIVFCNAAKAKNDSETGSSVRSDARGEFLFESCAPKGDLRTVDIGFCSKDFAPDRISLEEITADMKPLKIVLKPGKKIIFKAVDKDGSPLEGVWIFSSYWRKWWGPGTGTNRIFMEADEYGAVKTDKDGRFVWSNAPSDRVDLQIDSKQYQNVKVDSETLKSGDEENVFIFLPLIEVSGNVTDAETGKPIPKFEVTEWFTFKGQSGLVREFGSQSGNDGKFTRTVGHRFGEFDKYYLRVEAEGYEGLSREIKPDDVNPTLDYSLKKAEGKFSNILRGSVLQPDGKPAANAVIGIATEAYGIQTNGGYLRETGMRNSAKTNLEGNFSISRSDMSIGEQDYKLLFLHDSGTLLLSKKEFEKHTGPIQLEAWGRIEGTVKVGNKPGKNLPIWCTVLEDRGYSEGEANVQLFSDDAYHSDEKGHYIVDRVFPGKGQIGRAAKFNNTTSTAPMQTQQFEIKPGETLHIDLGGGGYSVKGKIYVSPETPSPVDWRFAHVQAIPTAPEFIASPALTEEEKAFNMEIIRSIPEFNSGRGLSNEDTKAIFKRWEESPEGKAKIASSPKMFEKIKKQMDFMLSFEAKREQARYTRIISPVNEKGEFQLDDLRPGNWTLEVELNFPSVPLQWWDYADRWKKKMDITIPEYSEASIDETLEIPGIPIGYFPDERLGPEQ